MNPSGPFLFDDADDANVWHDVYAGQWFEWNWPAVPQAGPVVDVTATSYPDVIVDLDGVSGAYVSEVLFSPTVQFAINGRLHAYTPDPAPVHPVAYDCEYASGARHVWTVRVWQDYRAGRDWILTRLAHEAQEA